MGNVTIKGRARKSRARNVSSYYVNRTLSLCIMIATEGSSGAYWYIRSCLADSRQFLQLKLQVGRSKQKR